MPWREDNINLDQRSVRIGIVDLNNWDEYAIQSRLISSRNKRVQYFVLINEHISTFLIKWAENTEFIPTSRSILQSHGYKSCCQVYPEQEISNDMKARNCPCLLVSSPGLLDKAQCATQYSNTLAKTKPRQTSEWLERRCWHTVQAQNFL